MNRRFPYRYWIFVFLFFLTFICQLDRVAFSVLGARIQSAFHLNNEQFGWAISAFALAYAVFEIPSGILGDRIGQRSVFIRIVLWWSLFTALTGFTTGLVSLMIVRFLFGMGEAGAWPTGVASISRWMPAKETSRGYSSIIIGASLGLATGPLIVVPVAAALGWRAPFFVVALFGLVWVLVCYFWYRNNPSEMKNISHEERIFIETNRRIGTHRRSFSWKTAFRSRNLRILPLMYFCCQFGNNFYLYWMPIYVQKGLHFSENEMKTFASFVYVGGVISGFIMGFASDWLVKKRGLNFGRRFIGSTCMGMAALLFFSMGITTNNSLALICLFSAFFLITAVGVASFSTCVDIGGNHVGAVSAIMNTGAQASGVLIGIVVGIMSNITQSYTSALFVIGTLLACGAMMWVFVDPTKKLVLEETRSVPNLEVVPTV